MRAHTMTTTTALFAATMLAACGGSGGGGGGGGGPVGDGGPIPDTGPRGISDATTDITITGTVFAEAAPDRGAGGNFDPPPGAPVSSGGRIQGGNVFILDADGAVISSGVTDSSGRFSLAAPANGLIFMYTGHVEGYAGSIRVESQRGLDDYEAYDVVLPSVRGLQEVAAMSGTTHDPARGWIAVGINAVDEGTGGEGANVAASHDPPFNLIEGGVYMGNRLAPVCGAGGAPSSCVSVRTKQIFFPNVQTGRTTVTALDPPAGGRCALRFDVPTWRVESHTMTVVNVDCAR